MSQQPNQYILREDALSGKIERGKNKIYAKKGEKVSEISDCDNVVIVEGPDGNRFPVRKSILKLLKITQ